ncbi:hypothetical protein AX16_008811 [Volvariella volvacea WC 439]|nr:hypothetical protein AX16_008811 [Volvariella volvacea WC 439]
MDPDPTSSQSSDASFSSLEGSKKRNVNSFKIMPYQTITRGYTSEADKIMDYLEHGIFDALRRQYLRSFIFAIYLDSKDPTNIVEAYTFNFQYHEIPGTQYAVPVMTLGDSLRRMSLGESRNQDPIIEAAKKGRAPTLKDVKKSVKSLLKALIHAASQMDLLPKRRFATFKLFYTDNTPQDYEPPHFQAGDAERDKWFFMTHDLDEVPDKWSIGKVMTGHHSVGLSVTSIAAYLPCSTNDDDAVFVGITPRPAEDQVTSSRARQGDRQNEDAKDRNVVWAAEDKVQDDDADAEGDDDPDYVRREDGSYERANPQPPMIPVGIRGGDGTLQPISKSVDEQQFEGISEVVPTNLHDMKNKKLKGPHGIEETQSISSPLSTPRSSSTTRGVVTSGQSLPPSDFEASQTSEVAAEMIKNLRLQAGTESVEMLTPDALQSISDNNTFEGDTTGTENVKGNHTDRGLDCECGVVVSGQKLLLVLPASDTFYHQIEDQCCFCEGGCGRWFHVWYVNSLLRAIKVAETNNPPTPAAFAKEFGGGDNALARQLFKRLEMEGFIVQESVVVGDFGLTETHIRTRTRGRGKSKARKNTQKAKYIFNRLIKDTVEYANYFNPDYRVEAQMLGLPELVKPSTDMEEIRPKRVDRNCDPHDEDQRPTKRIKVSVTCGVDLAE